MKREELREKLREDAFREKYGMSKKITCPFCGARINLTPGDEFERITVVCWSCEKEIRVEYGQVEQDEVY